MYRNIKWIEPWDCLCTEGNSFEQELHKDLDDWNDSCIIPDHSEFE